MWDGDFQNKHIPVRRWGHGLAGMIGDSLAGVLEQIQRKWSFAAFFLHVQARSLHCGRVSSAYYRKFFSQHSAIRALAGGWTAVTVSQPSVQTVVLRGTRRIHSEQTKIGPCVVSR